MTNIINVSYELNTAVEKFPSFVRQIITNKQVIYNYIIIFYIESESGYVWVAMVFRIFVQQFV